MEKITLNESSLSESNFVLLNESHSPSLISLEEDVDLGGKTLYFVPGDVLRANGGTLGGNGTLSGIVGIEDTCQQLFQLGADGKCTVTFAEDMVLNVPFLRPEWFGAKGDLVFKYAEKDRNDNDLPPYYIDLIQLDQYNKGKCTDNSAAINETIRVAEELSIKTIKFNAANYFVEESIVIHKGNLRLEGSGALLREDQWISVSDKKGGRIRSQIWNSRTSTLFCSKGKNLITIGEEHDPGDDITYPNSYADSKNPGDPIIISDLQLWTEGFVWSDYDTEKDYLPSGINFCSCCGAPLWPFIIERCHFRNFYYAIHINSIIDYPVNNLRINECAFLYNMYCLHSRVRPDLTPTPGYVLPEPTLQTSWSLEFTRNKCHNNGFAMKTAVNKGPCRVEYNNLEGLRGFERENKSEPGVFAVDLELGQRAAAVIRYNHFEESRPRLVRVKGFYPNNWVTMQHNNTDGNTGGYKASNLCYFDSVILNTDEDAEVHNCIFENIPYHGKSLQIAEALDSNGADRFPIGSVYLRELPARPLVENSIKAYYKVNPNATAGECSNAYMQTPMGNMLMRYFYEKNVTSEYNLVVMQKDFDYDFLANYKEPIRYVTIDFPLINECNSGDFVICNQIQYAGNSEIKRAYTYFLYDKGGFYNVRQQFDIYSGGTIDKVKITIAVRVGTLMPIEGRFFIGKIVVIFSDTPLDMNYNLIDDRSVDLTESDSYLLKKGDFITVGDKKYLCHEEGYKCAGSVAFTKTADSNVISVGNTILPLGSIWKYGAYKFKVISPKDYVTHAPTDGAYRYTDISYVVETNAFAVALSGNMQCSEPGLTSL